MSQKQNTSHPPVAALAAAINGVVLGGQIATREGFVYTNPFGVVRLQQPGQPVRDLGRWNDTTASLAAAYQMQVAA